MQPSASRRRLEVFACTCHVVRGVDAFELWCGTGKARGSEKVWESMVYKSAGAEKIVVMWYHRHSTPCDMCSILPVPSFRYGRLVSFVNACLGVACILQESRPLDVAKLTSSSQDLACRTAGSLDVTTSCDILCRRLHSGLRQREANRHNRSK